MVYSLAFVDLISSVEGVVTVGCLSSEIWFSHWGFWVECLSRYSKLILMNENRLESRRGSKVIHRE